MSNGEVQKWADAAMYRSEDMPPETRAPGGGTRPVVTLLNATPDPLGTIAAFCAVYKGRIVRNLSDLTDDERRQALKDMQATVLNGPLETVTFTFVIEGVSRALTHQAVRMRYGSFIAQESLRFAVVEGEQWVDRCAYPPSLARQPVPSHLPFRSSIGSTLSGSNPAYTDAEHEYALRRDTWDDAVITAQQSYQRLIDAGVPAEDARGLMPHAITTRYLWSVNLRSLLGEAGKRLCTQAQFEWRLVMSEVARAIRAYGIGNPRGSYSAPDFTGVKRPGHHDAWQFEAIADLLRPVCYAEGKCGFMAAFDRGCTIRPRVERFAANNVPSAHWDSMGQWDVAAGPQPSGDDGSYPRPAEHLRLLPIYPREWLADPNAART
jgi:flavin-dependent thymidylate synthase